jgi:hypothetical protein
VANRDRVKLAFIHVPTEGSGTVGGRQVQGLGRVRGWMTPAQAGSGKCVGGLFGRRWPGGSALARGMAGQQQTGRQASSGGGRESSAHYAHNNRAQTAQPEDLGRDAGGARAGVRGWSSRDGVQHKPTWVRRLPPIRVGWSGRSS